MKRLLLGMMIFGGAALIGGCPIYPDQRSYQVCDQCCTSDECAAGASCNQYGQCASYPVDASTSSPCGTCAPGTFCTVAGGAPQCLPQGTSATDSGVSFEDVAAPPSGMDGAVPPRDASQEAGGPEGGTTSGLCNADSQCAGFGGGSKCIDGLCTGQSQLCSDGTQCLVAGASCVDGECLPPCGVNMSPCPAGYACDFNRGVCSVNPSACSQSLQCQGGAVCVETRCVAPCGSSEAGAQCPSGEVCVNGGCIPDQQARFTCQIDGNAGPLANACLPGNICLHGDCYPSCDVDSGGCASPGEACKSVTIPKGTYAVCAAALSLGSECNPAVGAYCGNLDGGPTSKVCIDGYCK